MGHSASTTFDVVIIGGGIMGVSTAYALTHRVEGQPRPLRVLLLEQATIDHERASSHDHSRILRLEYGAESLYTTMVERALPLWRAIERAADRRLYVPTGVLTLGRRTPTPADPTGESGQQHAIQSYHTLSSRGYRVDLLTGEEISRRFPQFTPTTADIAVHNPHVGGILRASDALQTLSHLVRQEGGAIWEQQRVVAIEPDAHGATVILQDSRRILAERVIVAAGPWTRPLLKPLLPDHPLPLRPTKQHVLYLRRVAHPDQFAIGQFPVFLYMDGIDDIYGFPLHAGGLFKAGSHLAGVEIDPFQPGPADETALLVTRRFLARALPDAAAGDLASVAVCTYTMTPDEDFIIDRLPACPQVCLGAGFSGHGFKFGPLIGQMLAALATDAPPPVRLERFALKRPALTSPLPTDHL